jgi:putative hemolysin
VGEHFDWNGWRIEVVDLDGPRIDKLLLQRIAQDAHHADDA